MPELYDVRIVCENNQELSAHKCVLVARLEYFEMMFNHTWAEQSTISLSTVPFEYMQAIVEFLYSLDVEHFRRQQYREAFLYNMIVFCDQFFIERLCKVCEILLLDKISIRKCGEMLDFACMYNCELLKKGCMNFICQNLARVLLQKSLFNCEPESISCLNAHYRKMFKDIFDYRIITPDSEAIDDECLLSFIDDFKIDLEYRMDENEQAKYRAAAAAKHKEKESKNKQSTRQHEREAISSMMESLSMNESNAQRTRTISKNLKDAEDVSAKLQAESKSWMKVTDKKDGKKKVSLEQAIKVNDILKQEEAPKVNYEKLNQIQTKTPEKELDLNASTSTAAAAALSASKSYNFNLAELATSPREKLSQKQRKRLTSETNSPNSAITSWRSETKTTPAAEIPNAWGVTAAQSPPTNSSFDFDTSNSTAATGSLGDPSSFANMMRLNSKQSPSSANAQNSFSQILAEEKRQRDYYDRIRHKSLALTQIEEQAIAELKEFYNVDNLTDEIITIQRKPLQPTMNFAVWQRN